MRNWIILGCLFCSMVVLGQQEHAWVYFKDKPNANSQLENPISILTQKALDRRTKQNITLTVTDAPIESEYVKSVASSEGVSVMAKSKWLNALHVLGTEENIEELRSFVFVDSIQFASKLLENNSVASVEKSAIQKVSTSKKIEEYTYGNAKNQTEMLGLNLLHTLGFSGSDKTIAVMDAGFYGVNTAGAFHHLVDNDTSNGEVLGGYDYVSKSENYYQNTGSTHGTQVLSTMGAVKEEEYTGTAPGAKFYLFVTEDVYNETPLEESLWVQAAEKADSLGVDIINTSLGYSQFDESKYDYTYADMNGETTFIAKGATIASEKGMLVVNSVGNSGNSTWKYLTTPADAKGIVAVGAVNGDESLAAFSSYGPAYDNRVKPETLAQGGSVFVVDENNTVKSSNGTSFSSPILAGTAACLWQAFPEKTSIEIRQLIIENSTNYNKPTEQGGYGVLKLQTLVEDSLSIQNAITLNDCTYSQIRKILVFKEQLDRTFQVEIYNSVGSLKLSKQVTRSNSSVDLSGLLNGLYILHYSCDEVVINEKIVLSN